jgi:hypothetical protein
LQRPKQWSWFGAADDDQSGSSNRREGLAQSPNGEDAPGQWIQTVDEDDIEITVELRVLESIVKEEDDRMKSVFHDTSDLESLRTYAHVRELGSDEDLRFVTGYAYIGSFATL